MALTNLLLQLKPEEVPDFMKGKFFELRDPDEIELFDHHMEKKYVGWVHIREDGRIEFGEPGV
jgi:hypothetical protein